MEPLAIKLRPKKIEDIIGQQHLIGKNQILLGDALLYEEDIYIIKKDSNKKENIFERIKKWFND